MRTIGFIGIALLAIINVLGLVLALQAWDWRGVALMTFMSVLLAFFAHTLWKGAKLIKRPNSSAVLAGGWFGEPVGHFLREQVAKSIEGRILIAGSIASLAMAGVAFFAPGAIALAEQRAAAQATLFGLWPLVAFVAYVKICGPSFVTSIFTVLSTLAIVALPFVLAYK